MANSSDNKKKKQRSTGSRGSLLNNLAFYAVLFLALVMIINAILAVIAKIGVSIDLSFITNVLNKIAMAIAILITVIASYHVARSKGRQMYIIWIVAAVLVVLSFVLGIALI